MPYIKQVLTEKGNIVSISGVSLTTLKRDIFRRYKSSRVAKFFFTAFTLFGRGTLSLHKSFLPELLYVLTQLPKRSNYSKLTNLILEESWMKTTTKNFSSRVKTSTFSDFNYNLKAYQLNFIKEYDDKKQKYQLKGNILAFEQGLGKTFTSLALMHGLKKDAVIIIAPKSTLRTVWKNEIDTVFKDKKDIWIVGEKPHKADFYIANYESIEKLSQIVPYVIRAKRTAIIVDESHNFRNVKAQRVIRLKSIAQITKCEDILLMSGTPIKALGSEMMPTLQLLDPFFDDLAQKIFLTAFGVNVPVALDILKNRLGFMMHRKTKDEVENLPSKTRRDMKIKVSGGDKFTLESVKIQVAKFVAERQKFYKKNRKQYEREYQEVIDFLITTMGKDEKFKEYLDVVKLLKKSGYSTFDRELVKRVARANEYEKRVLRPQLTSDLKHKFDRSKAVVKYVDLKIMGEVIGGLLNKLRSQMFSEMIKKSSICKIITESQKKTVCFSTFVDVVKSANEHLIKACKYDPILVFGETSANITTHLKNFKEDSKRNPLIATVQTLSTGVTLIEANTIIFLNKPWRHTDASQAEDRVHRIGQDTDVNIFTFILDTGSKPNLSTRMEDIVAWSKEMFEGIVGDESAVKNVVARFVGKTLK